MVVVPATFLGSLIVAEAAKGADTIKDRVASGEWLRALEAHGALATLAQWINQVDVPGAIGNVTSWLASMSASLVRGWALQLITLLLTFYLLFYFLRDRKLALDWLRRYHRYQKRR